MCLLVSGGHNLLLLVHGVGDYTLMGTTVDDAMGALPSAAVPRQGRAPQCCARLAQTVRSRRRVTFTNARPECHGGPSLYLCSVMPLMLYERPGVELVCTLYPGEGGS